MKALSRMREANRFQRSTAHSGNGKVAAHDPTNISALLCIYSSDSRGKVRDAS